MNLNNVFTIDFETTGIDAKTCHPVEVAVAHTSFTWASLIKPPIPIPAETSAVHHICDEDVVNAGVWPDIRTAMIDVLKRGLSANDARLPILVAHNAAYEKDIISNTPAGCADFPPVIWICTYKCALRVWPDAPAHKNEVLRYFLRLGTNRGRQGHQQPHSALHDTLVTRDLLLELLKHATIEQLVEWTELPAKLPYVPFGKHYKKPWSEVDSGYLIWVGKQADMREDVKFCAAEELKRRR